MPCRASWCSALPRLHAGACAPDHTHSPHWRAVSHGLAQRTAPLACGSRPRRGTDTACARTVCPTHACHRMHTHAMHTHAIFIWPGFENSLAAGVRGSLITVALSRVLVQRTAPLACGCVRARSHTQPALATRVTRSRATHCPACMRLAPSPWHSHSLRSRGLPHTRMPSHAHTSPALKSCPSVCRQHTDPGLCQCLQRGRCRCQPQRTVTRGLLRGRVPAVLRGHHRVLGP